MVLIEKKKVLSEKTNILYMVNFKPIFHEGLIEKKNPPTKY
jgi:hypothetical protein